MKFIDVSGTEAKVCLDIQQRQALGVAKYGQTVAQNPLSLRQWLQHAYEEALDQAVYLKRAMEEIDRQQAPKPPETRAAVCPSCGGAGAVRHVEGPETCVLCRGDGLVMTADPAGNVPVERVEM